MDAIIAVHDDRSDGHLAHADFVFNPTAHAELRVEAIGSLWVFFTNYAVAHTARSGLEASVHPAPRVKGLRKLHVRPVEDLHRIPARVFHLQDFQNVALGRVFLGPYRKLDSRRL